ncbi:MAG: endolytic transglycosylase MltG [Chloroflexi bacterium]|nr:endolytic transglycosylase MltG [Chloroflexota bacterium]
MSIRGGRSPREPEMPVWRASDGRGAPAVYRRRRDAGGGFRLPGWVRFLLFTGVLAGIVLIAFLTALRPVLRAGVVGWAWDNPGTITQIPLVADLVREDLGADLTAPAGTDPTEKVFTVNPGDSIFELAPRLREAGFVTSERVFLYTALQEQLQPKLTAGTFLLRANMTPQEVVEALVDAKVTYTTLDVTFREGLRIEQMTALLQTLETGVDPAEFYELATQPPAELLADYAWLELPEGASLEGFLMPATYKLVTSSNGGPHRVSTAEDLIRAMLDHFETTVGVDRINVPKDRGMTFFQIITLASIVEHEAALDEERALIAGVYQNRLDGLKGVARILNADPTVKYATDTMALRDLPFEEWKDFFFWDLPGGPLADVKVSKDLQGFQTYQTAGLIPGPISTASLASIDAALSPDTEDGYLYFVLIPETKEHAFAKTLKEHNANLRKYGYR